MINIFIFRPLKNLFSVDGALIKTIFSDFFYFWSIYSEIISKKTLFIFKTCHMNP